MTPGEMLAKMMKGDKSVTSEDFEKETVKYFNDRGADCKFVKSTVGSEDHPIKQEKD